MVVRYMCIVSVLGISTIEGFDMFKSAYAKKQKDAEKRDDEATATEVCFNSPKSSHYVVYFG